jgi:hypothetical protein
VAMSSHRCRNSPELPHLTCGSCMTWRTRQVIPGDDDHPPVVWHSVDVTGSAFGQPQTRERGGDIHPLPGIRSPGERRRNHEDAETRRSSVWTSVAATVATDSATTIRGYAVSTTGTSILPTLRLGHYCIERTTGRRRH